MKKNSLPFLLGLFLIIGGCSFSNKNNFIDESIVTLSTGDSQMRSVFIENMYSGSLPCPPKPSLASEEEKEADISEYGKLPQSLEPDNEIFYSYVNIPYRDNQFLLHILASRYEREKKVLYVSPDDTLLLCGESDLVFLTKNTGTGLIVLDVFPKDSLSGEMRNIVSAYSIRDTRYQRAVEYFDLAEKEEFRS